MRGNWGDWQWSPGEPWQDGLSAEQEAEQEARIEARIAAFTDRLYWALCLAAQSDNMVPWDNQMGLDDFLSSILDPATRERFHAAPHLYNEHEDAWVAFDVREDAATAIDRLIEAERIEFVTRNGWLCIHIPDSVDSVASHLDRVPEYAQETWRERIHRLGELRAMPYGKYLQTTEWHSRRRLHVESARHRCQVYNTKARLDLQLHTHHRTYERRGSERFSDLIVLCEKCHREFHGIIQGA